MIFYFKRKCLSAKCVKLNEEFSKKKLVENIFFKKIFVKVFC